ncbi:hypothetical protein JXQ70_01355 [bacterium]|nr:hypothetical protein [bacterium]
MPDTGEIKKKLNVIAEEICVETQDLIKAKLYGLQKVVENLVASSQASPVSAGPAMDLTDLKQASHTLKNAPGQSEIISAILNFAGKCVQRAAVFAYKNKKLYGWQAVGLQADNPAHIVSIKKVVLDATKGSPFSDVLKNRESWIGTYKSNQVLAEIVEQFGGPEPKHICIFPLSIKDRIIAILYGDTLAGDQALFQTDSLEIMSVVASLVMENISQTRRAPGEEEPKAREEEEEKVSTRPVKTTKSAPLPETMDEETRKLHEKAKRTARVIVGDISLYNKAKIEQGLSTGNLGELLRDDIVKGRELYHQRVPAEIAKSTNYYEETLIEMIAKGNRKALGF